MVFIIKMRQKVNNLLFSSLKVCVKWKEMTHSAKSISGYLIFAVLTRFPAQLAELAYLESETKNHEYLHKVMNGWNNKIQLATLFTNLIEFGGQPQMK